MTCLGQFYLAGPDMSEEPSTMLSTPWPFFSQFTAEVLVTPMLHYLLATSMRNLLSCVPRHDHISSVIFPVCPSSMRPLDHFLTCDDVNLPTIINR